jgi:hypothetical protein
MKKYEELYLELVYLDGQDVITASMIGSNGVYEGETYEPENWG